MNVDSTGLALHDLNVKDALFRSHGECGCALCAYGNEATGNSKCCGQRDHRIPGCGGIHACSEDIHEQIAEKVAL